MAVNPVICHIETPCKADSPVDVNRTTIEHTLHKVPIDKGGNLPQYTEM